jgi:hypothetical protein
MQSFQKLYLVNMKTLMTILLFVLVMPDAFSQTNLGTIELKPADTPFRDSVWLKQKGQPKKIFPLPFAGSLTDTMILPKQRAPFSDNMPNAFTGKFQQDVYVGNNGNGLDIYRSPIDNMPVVKPDKNFTSNMPVFNYQLLPDRPAVKPGQPKIYRFPAK